MLDRKVFEELKSHKKLTPDQVQVLLVALSEMFHKNEELSHLLEGSIREVHELNKRVEFYRSIYLLRLKGE